MSFFKDLFKRKPGGTFLGNLLRSAAHTASGGMLGNGAMMLKSDESANSQSSTSSSPTPSFLMSQIQAETVNQGGNMGAAIMNNSIMKFARQHIKLIGGLIGGVLFFTLIFLGFKKATSKKSKSRY